VEKIAGRERAVEGAAYVKTEERNHSIDKNSRFTQLKIVQGALAHDRIANNICGAPISFFYSSITFIQVF